ncbi:Putative histone deacetylase complex subunit cti6 [Psilocybe cubensis]|uniref:Histone deacetylase complex subunit cti6 n=2 Tax=Psilocybe cubensis TaxID=181762 RepID=A0ACB8HE16_PSICU|nr:Putative histone deacetylase complex subunit cti6 [Psilocybe cubensis]KAH9485419.1 Putative histone deacetylase complex subunit cti6 [Psilocybe cubensis]
MAQASSMGPPLSPRETRRSGRRSAPSASASASKSPDSDQPPRDKVASSRGSQSSATIRNTRKLKLEEWEDAIDVPYPPSAGASASGSNNGSNKAKRKAKDKDKSKTFTSNSAEDVETASVDGQAQDLPEEEEEQGITRCVCGSAEDDPDAGEFMVQCETCKVWQHGLCMGYQSEDQVHDDDYYCELCRPELHVELLKKLANKRPRQTSAASRQDPSANSRVSRSHSPSHLLKQQSKRRNTMNSRDAAFDESLKEIIEATAAEAAAAEPTSTNDTNVIPSESSEASKRKRKRTEDDTIMKKRTRSASTTSEVQSETAPPPDLAVTDKAVSTKNSGNKNKRGGARKPVTVDSASAEADDAIPTGKRPTNNPRSRNLATAKRPPLSHSISHGSGALAHEHGTRRNQIGTGGASTGISAADARAYRNSHAYAVSQQTLFTSWNLPDYLSHLEPMLPTHIPQPLEVRSGTSGVTPGSRGQSAELTMERGVKVKWPAKRMSVGDMNKRVRALVEWVGREQANALDRGRRREALEASLREQQNNSNNMVEEGEDILMLSDPPGSTGAPQTAKIAVEPMLMSESALEMSAQTMKMMEELMEELIGFQERFGPGAKSRDRERRIAT